jgi:Zn finger protein HypA/HybF involved in hydrogenase expression
MSLWKRLFGRSEAPPEQPDGGDEEPPENGAITLPTEPYVFECRQCGKVFEKRRRRPTCPECDSTDVDLVSE